MSGISDGTTGMGINKRTAVERVNSRLDVSSGLELHTNRRMDKMNCTTFDTIIYLNAFHNAFIINNLRYAFGRTVKTEGKVFLPCATSSARQKLVKSVSLLQKKAKK